MAAAVLHALGRTDDIAPRFPAQPAAAALAELLHSGRHCPPSSSLGRVFDAAAGLLGLCAVAHSDAEAACALEQAAQRHGPAAAMAGTWQVGADLQLDLLPLLDWLAGVVDAPVERLQQAIAASERSRQEIAASDPVREGPAPGHDGFKQGLYQYGGGIL